MATELTPLSSLIASKLGTYPTSDSGWTRFVQDHLFDLRNSATFHELNLEEMQRYRFRLLELLTSLGYDNSTMWIIMMMNDLKNINEFDGVSTIILPDLGAIAELYSSYCNFKSALEAADAKSNE